MRSLGGIDISDAVKAMENQLHSQFFFFSEIEELMKHYILTGSQDEALALLNAIMTSIPQDGDMSYLYLHPFIMQFNRTIINLLNECHISLQQIYKDEHGVEQLFFLQRVDETHYFFQNLIKQIFHVLHISRDPKKMKYYHRIMAFIGQNYMRELSLELLSEEISLSRTYINHILKSYTDRTFIKLLNEIRIQRACEYLEEGELKIKDVAAKIGFSSSKYFIQIFKEMQGVTPGQYKRRSGLRM
jgi:two-component system response regulator YesN